MRRIAIAFIVAARGVWNICAIILAVYFLAIFGIQFAHGFIAAPNWYPLVFAVGTWAAKGIVDRILARIRYELEHGSQEPARPGLRPLDA